MKKIKIGIIGCGTIGTEIARAIDERFKNEAQLVAIFDINKEAAVRLRKTLSKKPDILEMEGLIRRADIVIEAASANISGMIAKKTISAKKDIMLMSAGGIIKNYTALFNLARKNRCRIYLPSGALCGLDGVKAASLGRIDKVELTTKKPPSALAGAPFVEKNRLDLGKVGSESAIFEGNALEAVKGFPANINVSCTLSIAGVGPEKTLVRIVASPGIKSNIHEVRIEGEFGALFTRTENVPSPNNPKTSYMAVLSAVAMLKQILSPVKIGT